MGENMTRIIMRGCNGHMGRVIADLVKEVKDAEIVAGIDLTGQSDRPFPVYASLSEVKEEADVLIDFTSPKLLTELLTDAKAKNLPLVLCSTGYAAEQIDEIREASKDLAILRSANMSLGVNVLFKLVKAAAAVLAQEGFDIDIVQCPCVREDDGLAKSSRNVRLTPEVRKVAPQIYATLQRSLEFAKDHTVEQTHDWVVATIDAWPEMETEYFSICDGITLQPVTNWDDSDYIVGCITVYCGDVREIDNITYKKL